MAEKPPSGPVSRPPCNRRPEDSGATRGLTLVARGSEADALEALRAQGFTASFVAAHGALHLIGGTRGYRPDELAIRAYQRFEGVSDPDDMSIVYAIESADGIKGTLVDAFGVYANPAVTAVMDEVATRKGCS